MRLREFLEPTIAMIPIADICRTEGEVEHYEPSKRVQTLRLAIQHGKTAGIPPIEVTEITNSSRPSLERFIGYKIPKHFKYLLIDGHHRLTAFALEGQTQIKAEITNKTYW